MPKESGSGWFRCGVTFTRADKNMVRTSDCSLAEIWPLYCPWYRAYQQSGLTAFQSRAHGGSKMWRQHNLFAAGDSVRWRSAWPASTWPNWASATFTWTALMSEDFCRLFMRG